MTHSVPASTTSRPIAALDRRAALARGFHGNCRRARDNPALPDAVRKAMAGEGPVALLDRLAEQRLPRMLADAVEIQADAFRRLGVTPRDVRLYEWCGVAVNVAMSPVLAQLLASMEARLVVGAVEEIKLAEILLNVTLDDLADLCSDVASLEHVARATYPASVCDRILARRRTPVTPEPAVDILAALNQYVQARVEARVENLVGAEIFARYRREWNAAHERVLGSMVFGAAQNEDPAGVRRLSSDALHRRFGSGDRLAIEAANGNRVTFELIDLMLVERLTGERIDGDARHALLAGFRALEVAQQLCNCISTLRREVLEGDRSNAILDHAASHFAAQTSPEAMRRELARRGIAARGDSSEAIVDAVFSDLRHAARAGRVAEVAQLAELVEHMVSRTQATAAASVMWQAQVDLACAHLRRGYDAAGLGHLMDESDLRLRCALLMAHHCAFLDRPATLGPRL